MKRIFSLFPLLCLTLCVTVSAFEGAYVVDEAGTLTDEQARAFESQAADIAQNYGFGVYLVTVDDFTDYGFDDVYDCAVAFYKESNLGLGDDRDGELLFLSVSARKYALVYHGSGDTIFTEYGRDLLERDMVSCFRDNDWYGGFREYMDWSEYLLSEAASGNPLGWDEYGDNHPDDGDTQYYEDSFGLFDLLIVVVIPVIIAAAVCAGLAGQLKTVREASEARQYAVPGSLKLRDKSDRYTHSTETRVKVESDDDHDSGGGGSTHHSGGGFSGRSGSF